MSLIVVDTGPLVAAALLDDPDHEACVAWFEEVREPLVVPDLVIPEVTYLLAAGARTNVEADFLRSLVSGHLSVEHVDDTDLERAADLVETYADLGLGTVDAAIVAIAERLTATKIATLDRRHFSVVRPAHIAGFELLP
ncbi:MAG: PIN domain-containing protein [Acidimicrobiales bacterium]